MQAEDNALHPFPRIVFMGTPAFAVASLDALVQGGYHVVAVVTAQDKPAGRGMHTQQCAVKKFADENHIPTLQPPKLKDPKFLDELRSFGADLQVVVAFRMLPELVWNMPPMGTINVHGSLLPQYRGAAPINWAIINGETETGVTTFRLKHDIDTGDILLQAGLKIGPEDTAGEMHDRLKELGARVLLKTIEGLSENLLEPIPQDPLPSNIKHAPKIFTETCRIDPQKTTVEIHNLVRGLSPYPGAFTMLDGKVMKIYRTQKSVDSPLPAEPGKWYSDGKQRLSLCCSDGWIDFLDIQMEGKKRMKAQDFLKGYRSDTL